MLVAPVPGGRATYVRHVNVVLPTAARARLMSNQHPARTQRVTGRAVRGGRTIHSAPVERTRAPTARM